MNLFDWLFRNRVTGEITIWQAPNLPAFVAVLGAVVAWLFPDDVVGRFARVVSLGSLVIWALQELFGGVNPNRRITGAGTLGLLAARFLR